MSIEHELNVDASLDASSVMEESEQVLAPLFEALNFRRGAGLPIRGKSAVKVASPSNPAPVQHGRVTLEISVLIVKPLAMPKEARVVSAQARLPVWLRLANEARDSRDPASALRNYYMIWEDMHGRPTAGPALDVKLARDFVSHGEPLSGRGVLAFLQQEFGAVVTQYDPGDPTHQKFVRKWQKTARQLLEAELEKLLS